MFGEQKGYFANGIFYKVKGNITLGNISRELTMPNIKEYAENEK
ncbi:hypothetical protein [Borreliella garinii]|nr:hypothetical protein [Borreliella garinii]